MDEWEVFPRVAVATALKAQEQEVARVFKDKDSLYNDARQIIVASREATELLMQNGIIGPIPEL
jgi:malate dehydrogenase (oxaloacetate-decarboxylating)